LFKESLENDFDLLISLANEHEFKNTIAKIPYGTDAMNFSTKGVYFCLEVENLKISQSTNAMCAGVQNLVLFLLISAGINKHFTTSTLD